MVGRRSLRELVPPYVCGPTPATLRQRLYVSGFTPDPRPTALVRFIRAGALLLRLHILAVWGTYRTPSLALGATNSPVTKRRGKWLQWSGN